MEKWDEELLGACAVFPNMRVYDWAGDVKNKLVHRRRHPLHLRRLRRPRGPDRPRGLAPRLPRPRGETEGRQRKTAWCTEHARSGGVRPLGLGPRLKLDLLLRPRRPPPRSRGLRSISAFSWLPEEDRQVGDPEPDEQHDQPAEGAIGSCRRSRSWRRRSRSRAEARIQAPIATTLPGVIQRKPRNFHVRRGVVEDRDHQQEDRRHHRPLGDAPDGDCRVAEADRPGDRVEAGARSRPVPRRAAPPIRIIARGDGDLQWAQLPEGPPPPASRRSRWRRG